MRVLLAVIVCFGITISSIFCQDTRNQNGKSDEVDDGEKQFFWPVRGRRSNCADADGNYVGDLNCHEQRILSGAGTLKSRRSKPELLVDLWVSELKEDFKKHPLLSPLDGFPQEESRTRGHLPSNFPVRTDERRIEPNVLQAVIGFLRDKQQIQRRNLVDPKIDPDKPFWPARG